MKHFKWEERGKRRIHKKPSAARVNACHPWLEAEIEVIEQGIIVCLGATTAQMATVHPSSLLRITNESERHREYQRFVADLKGIAAHRAARVSKRFFPTRDAPFDTR